MEIQIDPRMLPPKEEVEETTQTQAKVEDLPLPDLELETLKAKNFELKEKLAQTTEQKKHWREKYERDIVPKSSEELELLTDDEVTRKEIGLLKQELASFKENQQLAKVADLYPAIKEKSDEFNEFRAEYPGIALDKVAKIFVAEKGYGEQLKPRIGLEKPTGGSKANLKSGFSQDEVKRLRETQPRRYEQMLRSGKLNPTDII